MKGNVIVEGAALDLLQFVAAEIENVDQEFHAYPVKRSWHLIQNESNSEVAYCFWGASYKKEREDWGRFTQPISITLPYMVVTRKGELASYVSNGEIAASKLLNDGYSTVVYDRVINPWTKIMDQIENKVIVKVTGINKDLSDHTLLMVERKRIDFGYVSHRAIANLDLYNHPNVDLYEIREMNQIEDASSRVLCSKTALGKKYAVRIDDVLSRIKQNRKLNTKLRDLTFKSEGYPENLRARFNLYWHKMLPYSGVVH